MNLIHSGWGGSEACFFVSFYSSSSPSYFWTWSSRGTQTSLHNAALPSHPPEYWDWQWGPPPVQLVYFVLFSVKERMVFLERVSYCSPDFQTGLEVTSYSVDCLKPSAILPLKPPEFWKDRHSLYA